jgi:hypothetical protein
MTRDIIGKPLHSVSAVREFEEFAMGWTAESEYGQSGTTT